MKKPYTGLKQAYCITTLHRKRTISKHKMTQKHFVYPLMQGNYLFITLWFGAYMVHRGKCFIFPMNFVFDDYSSKVKDTIS